MTDKERERAEILRSLEPLFTEAERTGKWFYLKYQAMWFTPTELRVAHNNNKFVWGAVNWELRDPLERIRELKLHLFSLLDELENFTRRIASSGFTAEEKFGMYTNGEYTISVPGVQTANWSSEDWIRYIDLNHGWRPKR